MPLFGFLRIEEVVQSGISDHTLEVDDILYRLYAKHNQSNNEFIKNWSVWQKINFANFKKYWKKNVYPFQNIELFLKMRPKIKRPLFIHLSQKGVNRFQFCSISKSAIRFAWYNPGQYNTHSFIIGAATTVVMLGKTDDQIKEI